MAVNKNKILNDPVYGFVTIPSDLIFDIIEEPVFQRLRRIRQLGLTDFVYPGALHTRFHHAIGAMHLMGEALKSLQQKGHNITSEECHAAQLAILLHDLGHGPFSHALEHSLLHQVAHEHLSLLLMDYLNRKYNGALDLTIQMFNGTYSRRFFHQLISSQLDMDRLDYLQRDCFFTGVTEGAIGADRIIQMLDIVSDQIVVQEKGIYSIENFLNARRFMYWQVYLHKTTLSAELMLVQAIKRARELFMEGKDVFLPLHLKLFVEEKVGAAHFQQHPLYLQAFIQLDDFDIWACLKAWVYHPDQVLAGLSRMLIDRKLFKIRLTLEKPDPQSLEKLFEDIRRQSGLEKEEIGYFLLSGQISNAAYLSENNSINILSKKGEIRDISEASDLPNIKAMSKIVKKYYVCWPRGGQLGIENQLLS
jgi:HD superfamily phosphohydrolase